ncbi:MAG: MarR family transcriptional regulator [Clostridia bacterium]|nr:MarR family transcriptional regulator [Clostridia bacterium]
MIIREEFAYVYYMKDKKSLCKMDKVGKWTCSFEYEEYNLVELLVKMAVEQGVVNYAKHSSICALYLKRIHKEIRGNKKGYICFYLDYSDIAGHKRVIEFLIKQGLIKKVGGVYENIVFSPDDSECFDTEMQEEMDCLLLCEMIDLRTGEWKRAK